MIPLRPSVLSLLDDRRIVVVVRQESARIAEQIARATAAGGLRAVEITMSVTGAAELIATLRATLEADVLVGAGTVLSTEQLDAVLAADAQFVVAPGLDRAIVEHCAAAQVPVLPGVMSPTEVMAARALGLDALKLFPSETGGPAHLRALRAVFPDVAFIPTGGVSSANAASWFGAGARAVGMAGEFDAAHRGGGGAAVQRLAQELCNAFEARSNQFSDGPAR